MSVSNGLTLRTTNGVQTFRFFVALPVYRGSSTTVEDRRENLSGVIGGVFKTATVMDTILSTVALPHDVDLYLFPSGGGPIYSPLMSGSRRGRRALGTAIAAGRQSRVTLEERNKSG